MRRPILTSIAAISALSAAAGASLGAAYAAPEPLAAKPQAEILLAEKTPAADKQAPSALAAILAHFVMIEMDTHVTQTAAAETKPARGECPESARKPAEPEGASEDEAKKKQLVGPEPIYFAF